MPEPEQTVDQDSARQTDDGYGEMSASVARGGLWSIAGQAAGFGAGLVATPFTIRLLGPTRYGLWALLQTCLTWIGLADFGMASASTRFAGDSLAKSDAGGEVRAVWTSAGITVIATSVVAGIAAVAAHPIVTGVLRIHGELIGPAVLGLRILCAALVAQAISGTLNTSQQIRLKWRSYTLITTGTAVVQVILIPVALKAVGGGVTTATAVALAMSVACALGTIAMAVRLQPALSHPRVSPRLGRAMLRYGGALTISGLATIPLTSAERLFLAHNSSPSVVAYYVVASRLGALISAIPAAVAAPLFPALVRLAGAGDSASTRRLYQDSLRGAFLLLTPAAVLLAFIAHPFLTLWAGAIYGQKSTTLFYIVLAGVWFNSLAYVPVTYLLATGRAGIVARVHVLELAPYLVGAGVLTARFGATGAAVVWSARSVIDAAVFFPVAARAGSLPNSPLSTRRIRAGLAPLCLGAAALLLSPLLPGLVLRASAAVLLAAIYAAVIWWIVLTGGEQAGLRHLRGRIGLPGLRRAGA